MKSTSIITVLLLLGTSFLIGSCKKININKDPNSTFSFMAGNVVYAFDGVLNDKNGAILYMPLITNEVVLKGQNTDYTYFRATMYTFSLTPGSYTASVECRLNTKTYQSSGNFTISITSYDKDLISGTFSGDVYESGSTTVLSITNGNFHDLKIEYTL